jgi:hypothetical protein
LDYNLRSTFGKMPDARPATQEETADVVVRIVRHLNDMSEKVTKELTAVSRSRKDEGATVRTGGTVRPAGAGGGGLLQLRTVDGSLVIDGVIVIELDRDDGLKLTNLGGGRVRLDLDKIPLKPAQLGQVLYAKTGEEFVVTSPLCGATGWLSNDHGILLYPGE